jgi:hypothetical protein
MYYKLKYSSLISLKKKDSFVLYLKGPLGINCLKVPSYINFAIDNVSKVIIFSLKKKKKKNLIGFLSIFENSCRILVFGDLIGLSIQGLGLKFLKINNFSVSHKYLSMSLGYSDPVHHFFNTNCSLFFYQDIRNIYIYSTDYAYLRNQIFTLLSLKKPNKFQKRKNGITLTSIII